MSLRAACRLEALGFTEVYDYTSGKVDWLARALPVEGERAAEPRAKDLVVDDVVTCTLREPIRTVRGRVAASGYGFAFVVSDGGVLLGRLRRAALEAGAETPAEEVMEPGPSTIRPDQALEPLAERMRSRDLTTLPVTTPDGRLLGVVRRDDLDAALRS